MRVRRQVLRVIVPGRLMFRLGRALARALRAAQPPARPQRRHHRPGRVLLRLSPGGPAAAWPRELDEGAVLVSATNGKTTTCAMVGRACSSGTGSASCTTAPARTWAGAWPPRCSTRGREPGQLGPVRGRRGLAPPGRRASVRPRAYLLSNLFRDQLDRYGELELLADRWAELVAAEDGRARFVLNADDPLVADLGREREGVVYFGLEDDSQALPELQHAADSKHCRNCGAPYVYDAVYLGHLGRYRCDNCGRTRPEPQVVATRVELEGMAGLAGST